MASDYDELNERQKAFVNAAAQAHIEDRPLDEMMEMIMAKPYNAEYAEELYRQFEELIEQRERIILNKRDERAGRATYEGPPLDLSWQFIHERPVRDVDVREDTYLVTFELNEDDVFKLIRELDEEHARQLFDAL